jgi:SHS2 domain-containing protein
VTVVRGSFVEIDHSGDVGIEAWGDTPVELFANVTAGLISLASTGPTESVVQRTIVAHADRPEDLLVDWLGQVILSAARHGEVYSEVRLDAVDAVSARGVLAGAPLATTRRSLRFDVKAATFHRLLYELDTDGRHHARVIFDL